MSDRAMLPCCYGRWSLPDVKFENGRPLPYPPPQLIGHSRECEKFPGVDLPQVTNTASDGVKTAEPPVWHCPDCALPFDTKRPHCGSAAHYRNDEVRR